MTRAIVRRDRKFWTVTYDGIFHGRMRSWADAMKHAACVAAQMRRGEPTA